MSVTWENKNGFAPRSSNFTSINHFGKLYLVVEVNFSNVAAAPLPSPGKWGRTTKLSIHWAPSHPPSLFLVLHVCLAEGPTRWRDYRGSLVDKGTTTRVVTNMAPIVGETMLWVDCDWFFAFSVGKDLIYCLPSIVTPTLSFNLDFHAQPLSYIVVSMGGKERRGEERDSGCACLDIEGNPHGIGSINISFPL